MPRQFLDGPSFKHRSRFPQVQTVMPILPVLDLMNGQVVRGIGGRRDEYRPIVSKLVDSAEPLAVAGAFREYFGFEEFYLADLDAIQHGRPSRDDYCKLHRAGFRLWIDAGLNTCRDQTLYVLMDAIAAGIIVGLESVEGPEGLRGIVARVGSERVVFSLDLKAGQPIGRLDAWDTNEAWQIAQRAIADVGVQRLIVLDLARVGVGEGVGTEDLCVRLKATYPDVQLTAGGGIRGIEDVRRLEQIGVDYVLVASALHDGRIRADV